MDDLIALINSLSDEEVGRFYAFAKARNKRQDTYNLSLFKLIRSGQKDSLDFKLYNKPNKAAFYGVSRRLKESLIEFLGIDGFAGEQQFEHQLLSSLLAARKLLQKGVFKSAFKILKVNATRALEEEHYSIYHEYLKTQLENAHLVESRLDREILEYTLNTNRQRCETEDKMILVFSIYNSNAQILSPKELLQLINERDIPLSSDLSQTALNNLIEILVTSSFKHADFKAIRDYILPIKHLVSSKKTVTPSNHYWQSLSLLKLSQYQMRTKDFKGSLDSLSKIDLGYLSESHEYDYSVVKALNQCFTGKITTALDTLTINDKLNFYLDIPKAMLLLLNEESKPCLRLLRNFNHTDLWYSKRYGQAWSIKKSLLELCCYVDLEQYDLAINKCKAIDNQCEDLHKLTAESLRGFLSVTKRYIENPHSIYNPVSYRASLSREVFNYDFDVLGDCLIAWIDSKHNKVNRYQRLLSNLGSIEVEQVN